MALPGQLKRKLKTRRAIAEVEAKIHSGNGVKVQA